jgi:epoxyqueuosine reductase
MSSTQLSSLLNFLNPEALGFAQVGATELKNPLSLDFYKSWLAHGYHGDMEYLASHLPQKENPGLIHPRLESALVFTFKYLPHPFPAANQTLRIAQYVGNSDYHLWLKEKLQFVCEELKKEYPNEIFLPMTDSTPVLERDLAVRSGLGWFGKNTCLLSREEGSFSFIGEILTSLKISSAASLSADFCGTCTRCMDICPTQALEAPRLLNANKCISYLTIESQNLPEESLRSKIGDWFFGCDLCQTVCPWNQKVFGKNLETNSHRDLSGSREALIEELRLFLTLSGKQLQKKFGDSPLIRARPFGLRRNAIIVATNQGLKELISEISAFKTDDRLGPLVEWSLKNLV